MTNQPNAPTPPADDPGDYNDPTPIVLPWWINEPLLTMTDGVKCIDNVRENSALYRVMIGNGWTEAES